MAITLDATQRVAATNPGRFQLVLAGPGSGKTTTLSVTSFLMPRCIATVEITDAALYRSIKKWNPSFAIDEFDDVLASRDHKTLRSAELDGEVAGRLRLRAWGTAACALAAMILAFWFPRWSMLAMLPLAALSFVALLEYAPSAH